MSITKAAFLAASSSLVLASAAYGQSAPAASESGATAENQVSEVVVTGSRIARKDYISESPVVSVTQNLVQNSGTPALEATINQLPQFNGSSSQQATVGGGTGLSSGAGRATINLRGLGPARTLVLLDGRRLQPSDTLGTIDLNTVSSNLIDSIEIITGGASAVYGSDAVAGVVNLKLKQHYNGAVVDAQYGLNQHGGGGETNVSALIGGDISEGRGNAVISLSYYERAGILRRDVPFFSYPLGSFRATPGACCFSNGLVIDDPVNLWNARLISPTLSATSSGSVGFNANGTLFTTNNHVGLDPNNGHGFVVDPVTNAATQRISYPDEPAQAVTPLRRYNAFGRFNYDLTPHVQAFAQFNYTKYNVASDSAGDLVATQYPVTIPVSNPYVQANTQFASLLASRPNPNAPFQYYFTASRVAPMHYNVQYDVNQMLFGLKGDVPNTDWTWEAFGSQGETSEIDHIDGYLSRSAFNALTSAADGGSSLCAGGFAPFDLAPVSAACSRFLTRKIINQTKYRQTDAEATLQGGLFDLPAGQLRFAAGLSYRANTYDSVPDNEFVPSPVTGLPDALGTFGQRPSSGKSSVTEFSVEVLAPLVKDLPFAQAVNLDLAYRGSNYDTSGFVSTYKASLDWKVTDAVFLRGGYSRSVRAPSVGQLYQAATSSGSSVGTQATGNGDPCDYRWKGRAGLTAAQMAGVRDICLSQGLSAASYPNYIFTGSAVGGLGVGNPELKPESADSFTGGVVFSPRYAWLPDALSRVQLSVDWYKIEVADAIGVLKAQTSVPNCFNPRYNPTFDPQNFYCKGIGRIAGVITTVDEPYLNLGGYRTSGIDIQLDSLTRASDLGLPEEWGSLALNFVTTLTTEYAIQSLSTSPFLDYAGTIGNSTIDPTTQSHPELKANLSLTYARGPFSTTLRSRYIGPMSNAAKLTSASSTAAGTTPITYLDISARYRFARDIELRGGIVNLLDSEPPVWTGQGAVDVSTFDVQGRRFFMGISKRF
jgi:outer membrane receptor protein involved in Fe transport